MTNVNELTFCLHFKCHSSVHEIYFTNKKSVVQFIKYILLTKKRSSVHKIYFTNKKSKAHAFDKHLFTKVVDVSYLFNARI